MNDLIVKEVEFNGEKLIGIYKEGKIYTPLKKFCEFLGVDYHGQRQRIKRDETLIQGECKIHLPSEGGSQETLTLEISFLPLWLTGIKSQQCKEEIRENLIEFKLKAKDVLADAFLGKRTENLKLAEISKKPNWIIKRIRDRTDRAEHIENAIAYLYEKLKREYLEIEKEAKNKAELGMKNFWDFKRIGNYDVTKEPLPIIVEIVIE